MENAAKDIALILPEARRRIESAWRDGRHWNYQGWQDRLIGNGLLRTLSERLIWRFVGPKSEAFVAMPRDGGLVDHAGVRCPVPGPDWTVHLWHPLDSPATTVAAWRERLARQTIQQPFIQAWRPVYVVTDAELATQSYSNRFAAHILEQAPVMAILKKRGWTAYNRSMHGNNAEHERVRLILPHHGVAPSSGSPALARACRTSRRRSAAPPSTPSSPRTVSPSSRSIPRPGCRTRCPCPSMQCLPARSARRCTTSTA
ncbi:DUF4132 domain-containing protein [Mesorhizobium sp. M4B.F.Ca.ET.215.01.1.1]|uniref:DUF4132 domain-containing protein n=1 Tax=unclassified Mesorhizobium TaxID=325217 RepID=UPI000FCA23E3|nr:MULTISPECIES: DUF4132 domain-containing protein [unclassified Mesorhizobium]RVD36637.1 DUF4132 domain-containing protein [Mesorhizobium sp. M4B.F.Ca.ET.019.03.1.1]TGQ07384.1 DUF4132 domain-containing protein [Mesorhizobium sp. M4B.F.Ca.ET.215.01.1.1]TGQ35478.1 DUF4132 domain-containing protein [Mesorhizobium sp. M00.F.Ca.ET.220.01.1.1]TGR00650.1 DUF4132 domain-containing protein [Mesorhizobium sp. M4B.F.Ca.ET.203.01.1.1]TGT41514.1 DUF4132 domain-containing protein [Mesorhizobium sp. M4B.F.C